ncbi:MAG: hypothetical protein ACRDH9_07275 [Actinomycetota bacterium]
MRARSLILAIALSLCGLAATPASQAVTGPVPAKLVNLGPGVGGFMSSNITYFATLAFESPAVSARVVKLGAQKRLYVSTVKGLSVYDVTDPTLPLLLGAVDFYNWENEDIAVSADGRWVLSSEFQGFLYTHIFEAITLPGGLVSLVLRGTMPLNAAHTIECIDPACDWAYGSEGQIYDFRDKANPKSAGSWPGNGHHVTVEPGTGLVWTDTTPIRVLDVSDDPKAPIVIAESDRTSMNQKKTAYQHNNLRPFPTDYNPRLTPEDIADPNLRPGEILLGEGETNFGPSCGSGSGPFATYDLSNFDQPGAKPFKVVDVFRPINGDYDGGDGDPAVNAMGCSGHWFDISPASTHEKIITSNGWYDHGTRVFEIDGKTAKIKQLGYFQPVVGEASASYWIDDETIYTVDYARGIDILQFDADAPTPTRTQFDASWLAKLHNYDPVADYAQWFCRTEGRFRIE